MPRRFKISARTFEGGKVSVFDMPHHWAVVDTVDGEKVGVAKTAQEAAKIAASLEITHS